jgi:hypothetical protein
VNEANIDFSTILFRICRREEGFVTKVPPLRGKKKSFASYENALYARENEINATERRMRHACVIDNGGRQSQNRRHGRWAEFTGRCSRGKEKPLLGKSRPSRPISKKAARQCSPSCGVEIEI